ncbi:GyrI-like domain-containing protein [Mariprofundus sp. KV]|uniref:AraC family transcriptional regulator n=1 Tax=Mariprofundus sp. KV TaxID=2608715 RepID=UPI00159FA9DA|nr:GyrI-like domain-containing protein [Mariprofundus sp. KV]NWF37131.1 AraC family transcriptional regulator [Mariprofundus sp. KV]
MIISIVNIKNIPVAALQHLDTAETVAQSIEKFREWREESGCSPVTEKRSFGIAQSNPEARVAETFHFDICGEVDADVPDNAYGVLNKEIAAGRYAKLRHKGSLATINLKVNALSRDWLPTTQECRGDSPIFFEYLNIGLAAPDSELITDIYFPLR